LAPPSCEPVGESNQRGQGSALNLPPGRYFAIAFCPTTPFYFRTDDVREVLAGAVASFPTQNTVEADGIVADAPWPATRHPRRAR